MVDPFCGGCGYCANFMEFNGLSQSICRAPSLWKLKKSSWRKIILRFMGYHLSGVVDVKKLDDGCIVKVTKCGDCANTPVIKDICTNQA